MASTFEHIQTVTVGSNVNTVEFANIDTAIYDSLQIIGQAGSTSGSSPYVFMRLNSDTGNNYGNGIIYRNGSSLSSLYELAQDKSSAYTGEIVNGTSPFNDRSPVYICINNASNTTFYKNWLSHVSSDSYAMHGTGWWKSTSAVTNIKLSPNFANSGHYFDNGSKFTLIGIRSA